MNDFTYAQYKTEMLNCMIKIDKGIKTVDDEIRELKRRIEGVKGSRGQRAIEEAKKENQKLDEEIKKLQAEKKQESANMEAKAAEFNALKAQYGV